MNERLSKHLETLQLAEDNIDWVVVVTKPTKGTKIPFNTRVYGIYTQYEAQKIARELRDSAKYDDSLENNNMYAQAQQIIFDRF